MTNNTKIFTIRNKDTGEFVAYKTKRAWSSATAAKLAYGNHTPQINYSQQRFDDQDVLEIIELTEYYYMYKDLCK